MLRLIQDGRRKIQVRLETHCGRCRRAMIVAVDGVHDLGGLHGFGPVPIEHDEFVYHERWEGRGWRRWPAIFMASTTVDRFRHTIEQMPPAEYLSSSYYEQ